MNAFASQLQQLTQLTELFRLFNNGKHLNRVAEPALWAELEREQETYQALFNALGYELKIDARGFAWFHNEEAISNVSKTSRRLALLFMTLFDTQADAGKPLVRFGDWILDLPLLTEAYEQHKELLMAEELDLESYQALLDTAARVGFTQALSGHWRLLPAVCRYLDHFEALATHHRETRDDLHTEAEWDDEVDDEEEEA